MTKEEKIKEAYGSKYHLVKDHLDENGWMISNILTNSVFDSLEFNFSHDKKRPYCLKGIERNNDWIKIESESDLPNDVNIHYHVFAGGEIKTGSFNAYQVVTGYKLDNFTHYQPIKKPQKPVY